MQIRTPTLMLVILTALVASGCIAADDNPADRTGTTTDPDASEGDPMDNTTQGEILATDASWILGVTGCLNAAVILMLGDLDGIDFGSVAIPAEAHGAAFNATLTSTVAPIEWGVAFWAGDEMVGAFYSMEDRLDAEVPDGSDIAQIISCGGVELNATFTVTA